MDLFSDYGEFYYKPTRDLSNFNKLSDLTGLTSVDILKGHIVGRYQNLGINVIEVERSDQQILMAVSGRADMFRSTLLIGRPIDKDAFSL